MSLYQQIIGYNIHYIRYNIGWRTYEPFRNDLRNAVNEWIRTTDEIDGYIDFDAALRAADKPEAFAEGFDSGDHLHPSDKAYERMAMTVPDILLK